MIDSDFYVYMHCKASDNTPFYIGKGRGNRAKDKRGRSRLWHLTVKKHGLRVKIVESKVSAAQAFELEELLIAEIGRVDLGTGTLVNHTCGGDGVAGMSDEARAQLSERSHKRFNNKDSGEAARKTLGVKVSAAWEDPDSTYNTDEYRESLGNAAKKVWADPASTVNSKAFRDKKREITTQLWLDPGYRLKVEGAMAETKASDEYREKISKASTLRWQDPAKRQVQSEQVKASKAKKKIEDPEGYSAWKANVTAAAKTRWQDPVYREKVLAARAASRAANKMKKMENQ
jgi:hypothetical protein